MSQKIQTSLIVQGQQGLPPFKALNNNGSESFVVGSDGSVYIYNVGQVAPSPTHSFLVLNSNGSIGYTDIIGLTGATGPSGSSGTSGSSG